MWSTSVTVESEGWFLSVLSSLKVNEWNWRGDPLKSAVTDTAKRKCCRKLSVIQRRGSYLEGLVRVWSYGTMSKLLWKHLSCPKSIMKTQVLLVSRQGLPGGTKWRRRAQSASLLMTTHWITIRKGQTTSYIARSITICWSIRPPLAIVGNSGMGNADQFATLSSPCLINSYLLTAPVSYTHLTLPTIYSV